MVAGRAGEKQAGVSFPVSYRLRVEGLAKHFNLHTRGSVRVEAFRDVNFVLAPGELLALTGPSGAGKSSVLKTLYRTYLPADGRAIFSCDNGEVVDLASCAESVVLELRRRQIGFVTQFLNILPRVSALDWVSHPLLDLGRSEEDAKEEARSLLKRLGIREELYHLSPLTFSGGEQQRVNIAHGIIAPRKLLLLDEPTASLDVKSADVVLELLQDLKERGSSLIAVFHDPQKIERVADKTFCVKRR